MDRMLGRKGAGNQETLEQQFVAAAKRVGIQVIRLTPDGAELQGPEGPFILNFDNLRRQWNATDPSERVGLVEFFARSGLENMQKKGTPALQEVRGRIRFRIAHAHYGRGTPAEIKEARWDLLPNHLSLFLVIDYPTTTSFVMDSTMKEWGASFADLYDLGYANMEAITDPGKVESLGALPGVRAYMSGDSYDASRAMLLGKLLSPWPAFGAIFAVPTRDTLFFAPVEGPPTMKSFEGLLVVIRKALSEMPYSVSDQVFWYDGQTWDRIPYMLADKKLDVVPPERFIWALMGRTGPPPKA